MCVYERKVRREKIGDVIAEEQKSRKEGYVFKSILIFFNFYNFFLRRAGLSFFFFLFYRLQIEVIIGFVFVQVFKLDVVVLQVDLRSSRRGYCACAVGIARSLVRIQRYPGWTVLNAAQVVTSHFG